MIIAAIKLIKSIFITTADSYQTGFLTPNKLLPQPLVDLYSDYYQSGAGSVVLWLIFALLIYQTIFNQGKQRKASLVILALVGFFWIQPITFTIRRTSFPVNLFFTPVPKVPVSILYIVLVPLTFFALWPIYGQLTKNLSTTSLKVFKTSLALLTGLLVLPILTGEIWIK